MPLVKNKKWEYVEFPYTTRGKILAEEYIKNNWWKIVSDMEKWLSESRKERNKAKKERKEKIKNRR